MAENTGSDDQAAATTEKEGQQFKIHRVYLKDVSYESPQTPTVFVNNTSWQPNVSLHINTESAKLENDMFESVLTITATVKLGEETAYLIELKQAGLFQISGFEEDRLGPMLGSFCPNLLFPFAREAIASLVQKGGFPQLLLDPVNFDALYAQHVQQSRQNAPAPDTQQ
jgi:preprotein translocase subunit SecB